MDERRQVHFTDGKFFKALNAPTDKMLNYVKIEQEFGASVSEKFSEMQKGSAVIRFPSANGEQLAATVWVGINNVSLMLNKEEINNFVFLLS